MSAPVNTADRQYLIVNADDFGLSPGINRGVIEAHRRGIVTSASLMVRWPGAEQAARLARAHPRLSLGLHLDLGEWVWRDGEWVRLYQVVPEGDDAALPQEIGRQLSRFRELVGAEPTHLDAHQHVHAEEPARSALIALGRELGVPVRLYSDIAYCGDFYGQTDTGEPVPALLSVDNLVSILSRLSAGVTELGCHPGWGSGADLTTSYRAERSWELRTLCDARVRAYMDERHITLLSFREVGALAVRETRDGAAPGGAPNRQPASERGLAVT